MAQFMISKVLPMKEKHINVNHVELPVSKKVDIIGPNTSLLFKRSIYYQPTHHISKIKPSVMTGWPSHLQAL